MFHFVEHPLGIHDLVRLLLTDYFIGTNCVLLHTFPLELEINDIHQKVIFKSRMM